MHSATIFNKPLLVKCYAFEAFPPEFHRQLLFMETLLLKVNIGNNQLFCQGNGLGHLTSQNLLYIAIVSQISMLFMKNIELIIIGE